MPDTPGDPSTNQPIGRALRDVCVYCASSAGTNPAFTEATAALGRLLANEGIGLVYGGGAVGLMGLIADEVKAAGGRVTGVIPLELMPLEVAHQGLDQLIDVPTMHERKAEMMDRADAFIALPGGFGTLEELAEVLTWAQLGIHSKPVGLLNVDGYYDALLAWMDHAVESGTLSPHNRSLLIASESESDLLHELRFRPVTYQPKWVDGPSPS